MANKPVLHRRDHEHGGADPVRIVWESSGTGGGGGAVACFGGNGFNGSLNLNGLTDIGTSSPSYLAFTSSGLVTNDSGTFAVHDASGSLLLQQPGFYQLWFKVKPPVFTAGQGAWHIKAEYRVWDDSESTVYLTMQGAADDSQMGAVYHSPDSYADGLTPQYTLASTDMFNFTDAIDYPLRVRLLFYCNVTVTHVASVSWATGGTRVAPLDDPTNIISPSV